MATTSSRYKVPNQFLYFPSAFSPEGGWKSDNWHWQVRRRSHVQPKKSTWNKICLKSQKLSQWKSSQTCDSFEGLACVYICHSSNPKKIEKAFITMNFSVFSLFYLFLGYYNGCFLQLETSGDQHQSGWHGQLPPEAKEASASLKTHPSKRWVG